MQISSGCTHRVLAGLALAFLFIVSFSPSLQFSLVHKRQTESESDDSRGRALRAELQHGERATSVQGKLASGDNAHSPVHQGPEDIAGFPTPDSGRPASRQAIRAPTTNIDNFPTSQRRRDKQTETQTGRAGKHQRREHEEFQSDKLYLTRPDNLPGSERGQVWTRGKTPHIGRKHPPSAASQGPGDQFTEVIEVEWDTRGALQQPVDSRTPVRGGAGSSVLLPVYETAKSVAAVQLGRSEALQQEVRQNDRDTHVPKMVLTAVGSVTALFGVCVMAAIFQCCCRKKRRGSPQGQDSLKNQKDEGAASKRSRSKSPSPQKAPEIKEEKVDRGQAEQDKLIEEDGDLGDFSLVQRETEILRSYRKPPPPKNRARASRVPRALKTADPNENPNVFKEQVDQEEREIKQAANSKTANGVTSPTSEQPSELDSSMLDEIDSTLAALHEKKDVQKAELHKTPPKGSSGESREPSVEKVLAAETDSSSQLQVPKPNGKEPGSPALSREELAKSLAKELSKSVSKERLDEPASKTASPKPPQDSPPKSRSAGASPKLKSKEKDPQTSRSQDNVSTVKSEKDGYETMSSPEGEETGRKEIQNVFALIDPTVGGGVADDKSKSRIPLRASSNPTQPTAPLRLPSGKDYKRFPVPSVHGDQMDQLMKSLKTRLKEDSSSAKRPLSKVSPEDNASEDLEPQSRDRSHSDPTKQQEEKEKFHQTHL